jgi:hypothetical protein
MSLQAFWKLTKLLGRHIIVDDIHCSVHEHIFPEIIVAVELQYLSSNKCLDLKTAYGQSLSSVYRLQNLFLFAVNCCPELDIKMPAMRHHIHMLQTNFLK